MDHLKEHAGWIWIGDKEDARNLPQLHSTAVWTVAPMIIHVKRVTMHSYPG